MFRSYIPYTKLEPVYTQSDGMDKHWNEEFVEMFLNECSSINRSYNSCLVTVCDNLEELMRNDTKYIAEGVWQTQNEHGKHGQNDEIDEVNFMPLYLKVAMDKFNASFKAKNKYLKSFSSGMARVNQQRMRKRIMYDIWFLLNGEMQGYLNAIRNNSWDNL